MLLHVNGLAKRYRAKDGSFVEAVKGVGFALEKGQILAFLGPNGAGKTTTIKMIAGLIRPDDGDASIAGFSVRQMRKQAMMHVGAVLEGSRNLYWRMTPLENCEYWGGIRGLSRKDARRRGAELLDAFGMTEKAHHTVQQLSRGMQQQVAICCSLLHEPALLLLDEPTLGLDLQASDRIQGLVLQMARDHGVGIVLTTHQMEVAEALSDRVAIIRQGEVILQDETKRALAAFSGDTYTIELMDAPTPYLRQQLALSGATFVTDQTFSLVLEQPEEVYTLLDFIRPIGVLRIERDVADLATVFRHYTQTGERLDALQTEAMAPC